MGNQVKDKKQVSSNMKEHPDTCRLNLCSCVMFSSDLDMTVFKYSHIGHHYVFVGACKDEKFVVVFLSNTV